MLMNNLDPEVAENPQELIVYGGTGRAARDWQCYDAIVAALRTSARTKPFSSSRAAVGIFRTHADAPRVLIANSNLVGHGRTGAFPRARPEGADDVRPDDAGSWIYIGSQGIVRALRDFRRGRKAALWRRSRGTLDPHRRLGGMGGAQPLAATMTGATARCRMRALRIEKRIATGYLDRWTPRSTSAGLDRHILCERKPLSVGLLGNAAEIFPELVRRGVHPTSSPTRPARTTRSTAICRRAGRSSGPRRRGAPIRGHRRGRATLDGGPCPAMLDFHRRGVPTIDYGNNIRQMAMEEGSPTFDFPGFVPAYIRPLFCRGIGPFRWCALSARPRISGAPTPR